MTPSTLPTLSVGLDGEDRHHEGHDRPALGAATQVENSRLALLRGRDESAEFSAERRKAIGRRNRCTRRIEQGETAAHPLDIRGHGPAAPGGQEPAPFGDHRQQGFEIGNLAKRIGRALALVARGPYFSQIDLKRGILGQAFKGRELVVQPSVDRIESAIGDDRQANLPLPQCARLLALGELHDRHHPDRQGDHDRKAQHEHSACRAEPGNRGSGRGTIHIATVIGERGARAVAQLDWSQEKIPCKTFAIMNGYSFAWVFTSAFARFAGAVVALSLGALAYLAWTGAEGMVWPLAPLVLGIGALLILSRSGGARSRGESATVAQLERSVAALEELVLRDPATGLYNRRALFERLAEETLRAIRHDEGFAVVMLDIDRFKKVNDSYGHAVGDAVIFAIAAHLGDHIRGSDLVARYGGEEFVLLLPRTGPAGAATIAERIRHAIAAAPIPVDGEESVQLTVSAGIATYPKDGAEGEAVLAAADKALYAAKRAGRNRIGIAQAADGPAL
ncbi:MAG: GGDEF domain-containing protein [Proteobacteria bacterium]|nr:GGDEF domain-containing protein [Pseudomonadota bacterium]